MLANLIDLLAKAYEPLIMLITVLYALAGVAALCQRQWPQACMLLGPVIINLGILWSLK